MVVIRLSKGGAKKRPFYHLVVANSRNARDGRYIERVGFYNPIAAGSEVKIQFDQERVDHWLSKGAQPSERVDFLLKNAASILAPTEQVIAAKAAKAKRKKAKAEKAVAPTAEASPAAAA
jgi:small subunit ribosomal protein S16